MGWRLLLAAPQPLQPLSRSTPPTAPAKSLVAATKAIRFLEMRGWRSSPPSLQAPPALAALQPFGPEICSDPQPISNVLLAERANKEFPGSNLIYARSVSNEVAVVGLHMLRITQEAVLFRSLGAPNCTKKPANL